MVLKQDRFATAAKMTPEVLAAIRRDAEPLAEAIIRCVDEHNDVSEARKYLALQGALTAQRGYMLEVCPPELREKMAAQLDFFDAVDAETRKALGIGDGRT